MAKKRTSATLGILIDETRNGGFYHLYGSAVWVGRTPAELHDVDGGRAIGYVSPERLRHVGDWDDRAALGGLDLESFRISSQGSDSDSERHLYGWETEYREPYSVDRRRAVRMAQTLNGIERKMEKLDDKYGRPLTFGHYVLRVAAAIGATRIVIGPSPHRIMDLADGARTIDRHVEKWQKENEEEPVCDECGQGPKGSPDSAHAASCSLHPRNEVAS